MYRLLIFCLISCPTLFTQSSPTAEENPNRDYSRYESELIELAARDQQARKAMMQGYRPNGEGGFTVDEELARAVQKIDAESTAYLKQMIDEIGWPTFEMVGKEAARAAWLLAQHADNDPELQATVLELMEPLVKRGQAFPANFALLTDRVRLAQGRPQIYGTQFQSDAEGVLRPKATEAWQTVDQRRAEMELPPMAEYAKEIAEAYTGKVALKPLPLEVPPNRDDQSEK